MTYEITFDGTQYAMDIRDMDPSRALRIIEILNEAVSKAVEAGIIKPVETAFVRHKTYGQMAKDIVCGETNKINAIKALRNVTSLGLKEAKDLIDFALGQAIIEPPLWSEMY